MVFPFLQQTFKEERYPLTAVCFDFSLLAKRLLQMMEAGGKSCSPVQIHPKEEAAGFSPWFPAVVVSGWASRVAPAPGEVPCTGTAAMGGAVATFLVILCRKGFLGVLWLFSLDHLSAAVFNELEKK